MTTSSKQSPWRVAVIGGGIAGLSAAYELLERAPSAQVTLFDASGDLGGPVRTERIDDYLLEWGPDMFVTDKPWAVELVERLGLSAELIEPETRYRRSLVVRNGRPEPVPVGFTLMAPARMGPMLKTNVLSPWAKLRLGLDLVLPRRTDGADESVGSFVRRRLGHEALERLVQPLVGGIYTADPDKLSLRATLPRFAEMERDHRSLYLGARHRAKAAQAEQRASAESGARYGMFVTLAGGVGGLIDALVEQLHSRARVLSGTPVRSIVRQDTGSWTLRYGSDEAGADEAGASEAGASESFDALLLAVPAHVSSRLLCDAAPELSRELSTIEYASSVVVASGHRLSDIRSPLEAFGMVVPHREGRRVLAVSFTSRKFPGRAPDGRILLRTFVGGALQPELVDLSDEQLEGLVREELAELLGVGGEPDFMRVIRYPRSMPQYHVGHIDRIERIERTATQLGGLALAGSAYRGVGVPDCVRSGQLGAERLLSEVKGGQEV